MALGGVATGSMKAQEAPIPIIIAKPISGTPISLAMEIKIGTKSAALAVLEVNSVRNMIKVATKRPMIKWFWLRISSTIVSTKALLAPEEPRTALRVSPPPKSRSTPQSVFCSIFFQLTMLKVQTRIAAVRATILSKSPIFPIRKDQRV